MKILVTGGPVHANLDSVKFISNGFKGGTILELAGNLQHAHGMDVTYLTSRWTKDHPHAAAYIGEDHVVVHDGFDDYRQKVNELAPEFDAIILGAAVANLIPVALLHGCKPTNDGLSIEGSETLPLTGKFPSHNYKVGDRIFMEWTIAPRVIDEVKARMRPDAHLFGFKLLTGMPHEELIRAAYDTLISSRSTAVFANDPKISMDQKYAVTKERGIHPLTLAEMPLWIAEMVADKYYNTESVLFTDEQYFTLCESDAAKAIVEQLIQRHDSRFVTVEEGYRFGTVAVRIGNSNSFWTTGRGKRETDDLTVVLDVDHGNRVVKTWRNKEKGEKTKATLNSPLLHRIFREDKGVKSIVHLHEQLSGVPTYKYAPPGTARDTNGPDRVDVHGRFNIEGHGCYIPLDKDGVELR